RRRLRVSLASVSRRRRAHAEALSSATAELGDDTAMVGSAPAVHVETGEGELLAREDAIEAQPCEAARERVAEAPAGARAAVVKTVEAAQQRARVRQVRVTREHDGHAPLPRELDRCFELELPRLDVAISEPL